MEYIENHVINFLQENNFLCPNHFYEEIYEKIEDEQDKEFYEKNSCWPVFYYRPNALIGEIGLYCRPYSMHGCRSCGNPYSKANRILRKRFEKIEKFTITFDCLSELFRKIENE